VVVDRIIFVCIIVLAAVYFYATAQIPSLDIGDPLGPKAFPRLLGVCLLISAALLLVEMHKAKKQPAQQPAIADPEGHKHLAMMAGVAIWTGLYFAVFEPIGYILSTMLYLLPLMVYLNKGKWTANVLTAVLFSIGTYVLFQKILGVSLPKGLVYF
jgi:putative tricarboxylic transport membrane protein